MGDGDRRDSTGWPARPPEHNRRRRASNRRPEAVRRRRASSRRSEAFIEFTRAREYQIWSVVVKRSRPAWRRRVDPLINPPILRTKPNLRTPHVLQSPLTDSNRRPPPYHAIQTATGGSRWQRFRAGSSRFPASATRTFATGCARSVPYLFHRNRPKNGQFEAGRRSGNGGRPLLSRERVNRTTASCGMARRSRWRRLITAMSLCLCRPSGDSAGEQEQRDANAGRPA